MSDSNRIAKELDLPVRSVKAVIELLADGNTIPFIARYRKEATGSLDEVALRAIQDANDRWTALESRKQTVLKSIAEQGKLSESLKRQIETCTDLRLLEEIYLPFKPKRRTRAELARQRGLQPLADLLLAQQPLSKSRQAILKQYVDPAADVPDADAALAGALDIVAEQWSEQLDTRQWLFDKALQFGKIKSSVKRGKKSVDGADKFEQYFDRQESVSRIPGHRLLAMLRGAAQGILNVQLVLEGDRELASLKRQWVTNREFEFFHDLLAAAEDAFQRLLLPATESRVLQERKELAEDEAIDVFGNNLTELLMAPPAGPRPTLGIDPGFRTGCKVAAVDETGKYLAHATIYPTPPRNDTQAAADQLLRLIKQHKIELIAIGNGTASRETDAFVSRLITDNQLDVTRVMVSESGASIYSASDLAAREFPQLDLTVRGAISIARRLQDPLAELVKTDAKSIGVGQYQHDVNQTKLKKQLDRVVESCVNHVGVDLNMASAPLLSYVAGIGPKLADNIVEYRNTNGRFSQRKQLTKVPKLGNKAFQQAAGFLRIRDGKQPLDNSAVHPERYPVVADMAQQLNVTADRLVGNGGLVKQLKAEQFVTEEVGLPTIQDILEELIKPGRDPRRQFRAVRFDDAINQISDLKPNMVLEGVITNVTHFGAFIDIGVHQDALIHISQLANQFVNDPAEVVSVGEVCKVKVLEVDEPRKRISVTRKF